MRARVWPGIAGLLVASAAWAGEPGAGIPVGDGAGPVVVRKVPVADCRAVRGFLGIPVDGSVRSRDYRGGAREYPKTASDGVAYAYNKNDGLHVTLADADGFDAVVLRGGARARLYLETGSLVEPQGVRPLHAFPGADAVQMACFPERVRTAKAALFGAEGGTVADISFYRIGKAPPEGGDVWTPGRAMVLPAPEAPFAPDSLLLAMNERYAEGERTVLALVERDRGEPVLAAKNRATHFITPPFSEEKGLAAVTLEAVIAGPDSPFRLTVAVQDPLDPRLDLAWVEFAVAKAGPLRLTVDVPDQVLLKGSRVWVTLRCDRDVSLSGSTGGGPQFRLHFVPREAALPEALAYRKMLLKTFFSLMSEPRPWGAYRRQPREEFYASSEYARQCPELFMTIDLGHALDPRDDLVRQYREWVYVGNLPELSPAAPPPAPPQGVPPWAWYPRLAWLEVRRIAQWWVEERMVPTGEFGGRVGDDSDMYQQYLDLPFFESGGVGAQLKDGAARMAELAEQQNLRGGLNSHATDALHAYEEGINHLALMARWFYGDPIYLERCMESARNMESLTVVTADGRRHFRDKEKMGAQDMEKPRPPAIDGGASPLMWHTALQVADYNRNPRALGLLREWADSWLRFMKPGQWATDVEVNSGKVLGAEKDRPLYGGYRSQACVFAWLAAITEDARYLDPFLQFYQRGRAPMPADGFLGEAFNLGLLDGLDEKTRGQLAPANAALTLYLRGDPAPLVQAVIGHPRSTHAGISSLYDARRWPDMYTAAEQFTDRIFPNLLEHASVGYLGGFTRRNKFNPALAVSWEGLGTEYAALVVANRRDHLKVLLYSFADAPVRGRMRVWALEHGQYRVTVGPDTGGNPATDRAERTETLELARADAVEVTLPPRRATVIEIRQVKRLDPLLARADLALAAREVAVKDNVVTGVVHNLGAADVDDAVVAAVDAAGRIVARQSLGRLAAPVDLVPKRLPFVLRLPEAPRKGWRIVADPERQVPEIHEGNNEATLDALPAPGR